MKINRLGAKISLLVIGTVIFIMVITMIIVGEETEIMISDMTVRQAQTASYAFAKNLEKTQEEAFERATLISLSDQIIDAVVNNDRDALYRTLENLSLGVDVVLVCDEKGTVLARSNSDMAGDNVMYQEVVSKAIETGEGLRGIGRGSTIELAGRGSAPIKDRDGKVIGAVICNYDLAKPKFLDDFKALNGCEVTISIGNIRVNSTLFDNNGKRIRGTNPDPVIIETVQGRGEVFQGRVNLFGKIYEAYCTPLKYNDITVGMISIGVDVGSTLVRQRIMNYWIIATAMAGVLVASILVAFTSRIMISRPLAEMGRAAQKIKDTDILEGTYEETKLEVRSTDEVGVLAAAFNGMLDRLYHSNSTLNVLENILNGMDAYIFVSEPETGTILFANDKMISWLGFEPGHDITGKLCWEAFYKNQPCRCDDCPVTKLNLDLGAVIVTEEFSNGRYYRNTDRIIMWRGGIKAHLLNRIDITDIKAGEKALSQRLKEQKFLADLLQSFNSEDDMSKFVMHALQMVGEFIGVNKVFISRYLEEENTLECLYEWHDDSAEPYKGEAGRWLFTPDMDFYKDMISQGYVAVDKFDYREHPNFHRVKDFTQEAFLNVAIEVSGEMWGILGFVNCVSPYSWTEGDIVLAKNVGKIMAGVINRQIMRENLLRMSSIVNSSPNYISYVNRDGEFGFVNQGATDITGYSYEELMEYGMTILYDEKSQELIREVIMPAIFANGEYDFELPYRRKNGDICILSASAFVIDSDEHGVGCIATDVTENKRLERELIEAMERAEKASSAKSEFLSWMSHEMRTPMNAIIGMTGIARGSDDIEKKEYCLEKIDSASRHLLGVINNILDMSKIESGKFDLFYDEFDFEGMLTDVVGVINFRADEKNQTLVVNLNNNVPRFAVGDEQRISQVITNLLSNAVKFTPDGGRIVLNVDKIHETDEMTCTIQFEVIDTGIGISKEHQQNLFQSFEQANSGITRKYGGTGLGLAISKRIVEQMGGQIWIESEFGKGAKFVFTIEVERGASQNRTILSSSIQKKDIHILAVDDSLEIREYFLYVMEALDLKCDVAESGAHALSMIESRKDKPYNIFFVDWLMPYMDGIDLAREIKRISPGNPIVIMISAARWNDVEHKAREVGINWFVPKPLFPSSLINAINECMVVAPSGAASEDGENNKMDFSDCHLLLVEDVEINREIVLEVLKDTKAVIDQAENGIEAVRSFESNPDKYDLILMDIHMPEMDGYEAARRIRGLPSSKAAQIPIIAMTANVFREDVENCLAVGMNDHIGKPINISELFNKLHKYLKEM